MIYEKTFLPSYLIGVEDGSTPLRNITLLALLKECGYLTTHTQDHIDRIKTITVEFAYYDNGGDMDITGFTIDDRIVRVWNDLPENRLYTVNDDVFISSLLMWGELESIF